MKELTAQLVVYQATSSSDGVCEVQLTMPEGARFVEGEQLATQTGRFPGQVTVNLYRTYDAALIAYIAIEQSRITAAERAIHDARVRASAYRAQQAKCKPN